MSAFLYYIALSGLNLFRYFAAGLRPTLVDNIPSGFTKKSILQKAFAGELTSPEGTEYEKDGPSPSDKTPTNKNPERVI